MDRPPYYNDLALTLDHAWSLWVRGGVDRRSAFHTPVVATVDAHGAPQARVMVLRQAQRALRSLRFHTDIRSAKVTELAVRSAVSVLGYDAAAKIQLRLRGSGQIIQAGPEADSAWDNSRLPSRKCYLADPAPGTASLVPTAGLAPDYGSRDPTPEESLAGRANFAVLMVCVDSIEWVYLAASGHRRARFDWTGADWAGSWLIP